MGLEFIDRTLKTTGLLLLVFLPFGLYYFGVFPSLAIVSGGVWGILNLIFTSALIRATIRPGGVQRRKAIGIALFKFPVLYVSGYFLLRVPRFEPLLLLIGFSSLIAVMVLKALGGLLTQAHDQTRSSPKAQELS